MNNFITKPVNTCKNTNRKKSFHLTNKIKILLHSRFSRRTKFYLMLGFLLWTSIQTTQAQSTTYSGNITVRTQTEVENFRSILTGVTTIEGNVTIGKSGIVANVINDISIFSRVDSISGNLGVIGTSLSSLDDFNSLQYIGGEFSVNDNNILDSLGNFNALQNIGGNFALYGNSSMTSLGNFDALQSVGGSFTLTYNDVLYSLANFNSLQIITEDFFVFGNPSLTSLGSFNALQSVGKSLFVSNNNSLDSLGDFAILQNIGRDLDINGNSSLTSLGNFNALHSIGRDLDVHNNNSLLFLGDFTSLQFVERLFSVIENTSMSFLGDFSALQSITAGFTVTENDSLSFLGDFSNLDTIKGDLSVYANNNLDSLGNFSSLQFIGGNFTSYNNLHISSLGSFTSLQSIKKSFAIIDNPSLTSLGDFTALQSIERAFIVTENNSLISLGDLTHLTHIGTEDSLSVSSIGNRQNNVSIIVENNDNLVSCCVLTEFLLERKYAASGKIFINNNAEGCNSKSEILLCIPSIAIIAPVDATDNRINVDDTTQKFNITLNVGGGGTGWVSEITEGEEFITSITPQGEVDQKGDRQVTIFLNRNNGIQRSGIITFRTTGGSGSASVMLTVIQNAGPPTITISSNDITQEGNNFIINVSHLQQNFDVNVIANGGAISWYTDFNANPDNFIDTINENGHVNGEMINIRVNQNTGQQRTGIIMLTASNGNNDMNQIIYINVIQNAGPPTITVSGNDITQEGNNFTINVSHLQQNFVVNVTANGGATSWYTDFNTNPDNFIDSINENGHVDGEMINIRVNQNTGLQRTGIITLTASNGNNDMNQIIHINVIQNAGLPTITVSGNNITQNGNNFTANLSHLQQNFDVNVIANGGAISWYTDFNANPDNFIDSINENGHVNGEMINIRVNQNTGQQRTGIIMLTASNGNDDMNQTIYINVIQDAGPPTITASCNNIIQEGNNFIFNVSHLQQNFDVNIIVNGGATSWYTDFNTNPDNFIDSINENGHVDGEMINIRVNQNTGLQRTGIITLTASNGNNDMNQIIYINVIQKAGLPTITVSGNNITQNGNNFTANLSHLQQNFDVNVIANGGATSWYTDFNANPDNFINSINENGHVNGEMINISVNQNTGQQRTGIITLTASNGNSDMNQKVLLIITQKESSPEIILSVEEFPVTNYTVEAEANTLSIDIDLEGTATSWTSVFDNTTTENFITNIFPSRGNSDGSVTVSLSANSGMARANNITFIATDGVTSTEQQFTINQAGATPTIFFESHSNGRIQVDSSAQMVKIVLGIGGGTTGWRAIKIIDNENFITLPIDATGSHNDTISIAITANNSSNTERSAIIAFYTIGGTGTSTKTFEIIQTGRVEPSTISITHPEEAMDGMLTVGPESQTLKIALNIGGSATGWKAIQSTNEEDFVSIPEDPTGEDNDTLEIILSANDGLQRTTTIFFMTTGGNEYPGNQTLTITQTMSLLPTFEVISTPKAVNDTIRVNFDADAVALTVIANIGITNWTSIKTGNFISLDIDSGSYGLTTSNVFLGENRDNYHRSGTITFTAQGVNGVINQTLTIIQEKKPPSNLLEELSIIFYPNPVIHELTIQGLKGDSYVFIRDVSGKKIATYSLDTDKNTIDVSNFSVGIYIIVLEENGKKTIEKIIKI